MTADERPADQPSKGRGQSLVSLPRRARTTIGLLVKRGLIALVMLVVMTLIVFLDRGGYADNVAGDGVSFIDALYYATVTLTTTGYGDITPVTETARLISALVVSPLRVAFLVLLVGTGIQVLANEGRRAVQDSRWRKNMRNHTVVIGFGTMGRSAVATLLRHDTPAEKILVIDASAPAIAEANRQGLAAFEGDATYRELLRRAEIPKAREVIITVNRDDTAILTVLTVRQLNPSAHVIVAVREGDNVPLLRQSGANAVVTSSDAVGRLMGLSSLSPNLGSILDDLLSSGDGLEVAERLVTREEAGMNPVDIPGEQVLAVIRNQTLRNYYDPSVDRLETGDQLVVVRKAAGAPVTPEGRTRRRRAGGEQLG